MIDRSIPPPTYSICKWEIPLPTDCCLKNGIPVIGLQDPNLTLIRLDIRLKAGSYYQKKQLLSHATIKLMTEGTQSMSSEQIAEQLDYAGAYFEVISNRDFATFSIYFPKKAAVKVIPIVGKLFTEAIFPEDKIAILKRNTAKNLAINMEKTSYLAYSHFIAHVFGKQHPYGISVQFEDIDNFNREDIIDFYQQHFHAGNIRLFIAGNIDKDLLNLLDNTMGNIPCKNPNQQNIIPVEPSEGKFFIEKENAVQSSICIGNRLFNYQHKDWIDMSILKTVLGGYFGSRLMTNIREKKGLTYGIYSQMVSFQMDGLFVIRTDVNKAQAQEAIHEIFEELSILQREPVPQEELTLVKNYLYGTLLRNFDGVFSQIDRTILLNDYHFSHDYWNQYTETIKNITPYRLLELAVLYLQSDNMIEIVAG
ncbi:MAG: insulinase family protein [Bacteroidales bacterium]|jgi:predicted Zn-dependent peptidase|nr:insulinase family protein [Bacteroidales bacterium]